MDRGEGWRCKIVVRDDGMGWRLRDRGWRYGIEVRDGDVKWR